MFLGSRAAAAPYVVASKVFTVAYFAYFLVVVPFLITLSQGLFETPIRRVLSRGESANR